MVTIHHIFKYLPFIWKTLLGWLFCRMTKKLVSWNVNGIRAVAKKDFYESMKGLEADVYCFQETKANTEETLAVVKSFNGYQAFANASKKRQGYSGTCILTKEKPVDEIQDIGIFDHDQEGRVITLEFPEYYLVNVYVPNAGAELKRLDYRHQWNIDFTNFLNNLKRLKPVIVCGDFNVAHQEIDLKNAKSNYNVTAGYTQLEIDDFSRLLEKGFTDSFRYFYPDEVKYSYWSYVTNARKTNAGWRIDYFLVSNELKTKIKDAQIHNDILGSDHCPVSLDISF